MVVWLVTPPAGTFTVTVAFATSFETSRPSGLAAMLAATNPERAASVMVTRRSVVAIDFLHPPTGTVTGSLTPVTVNWKLPVTDALAPTLQIFTKPVGGVVAAYAAGTATAPIATAPPTTNSLVSRCRPCRTVLIGSPWSLTMDPLPFAAASGEFHSRFDISQCIRRLPVAPERGLGDRYAGSTGRKKSMTATVSRQPIDGRLSMARNGGTRSETTTSLAGSAVTNSARAAPYRLCPAPVRSSSSPRSWSRCSTGSVPGSRVPSRGTGPGTSSTGSSPGRPARTVGRSPSSPGRATPTGCSGWGPPAIGPTTRYATTCATGCWSGPVTYATRG